MSTDKPMSRDFESHWDTISAEAQEASWTSRETIQTQAPLPPQRTTSDAIEASLKLPGWTLSLDEHEPDAQFHVRRKLGAGGMGVVYLAKDRTLFRDIAVKAPRPSLALDRARAEMMREAWVTGRLEHPNIVPVHSVGLDQDGRPVLILKRIEGESWLNLVHDPTRYPSFYEGYDALERHLRVLIEVCHAIHFAHVRGILHRDLKPENVMVGSHGEVYVLDWGIAVSLRADLDGVLPLARNIDRVGGTPAYMAPEMTVRTGQFLTERTDVYQLGAILHRALTGQVRHLGSDVKEVVRSAYLSEPFDYSEFDVPDELARIANKSMSRDPNKRYASAEAFQAALLDFLVHRESHNLLEEAEERRVALGRLVRLKERNEETAALIHQTFAESRFGYQMALSVWPGNQSATQGLEKVLGLMFALEVDRASLRAAQALLSQMSAPTDDQRDALEALRASDAAAQAEVEELKKLAHDRDLGISARARAGLTTILLIVFGAASILRHMYPVAPIRHLNDVLLYGVVVAALVFLGRKRLLSTRINRQVIYMLAQTMILLAVIRGVQVLIQQPTHYSVAVEMLVCTTTIGALTWLLDRRLYLAMPFYPIGGLATAMLFPEYVWLINGGAHILTLGTLAAIWLRTPPSQIPDR